MSEKLIREFYCDACGKKFKQDELSAVRVPMWSSVSDSDGAYIGANVCVENADLCDECMRKHAVVERGYRCVKGYRPCPDGAKVYGHNNRSLLEVGGIMAVEND